MQIKLIVNKDNTAVLNTGKKTIDLIPEYRLNKETKFNKYTVRDGYAIFTAYAIPNKNQSVVLNQTGTSKNANRFETVQTNNLIVKDGYIAKMGHKIKLS